MKVKIELEYWADVMEADSDNAHPTYVTRFVWMDSRDLPEPPTAIAMKTGDMSHKRNIRFQHQPDGDFNIATACWTSGEPGKLYGDRIVVDGDALPTPPASGGTF